MNHTPRAPPPNAITLGIRFSTYGFGGGGGGGEGAGSGGNSNIQTTALGKENLIFSVTIRKYRFCI